MTLASLLEESARRCPRRLAVLCGKRRHTYRELNALANQLASFFIKNEALEKGSKIAILHENSPDFLICLFAIFKAGMTAVPVNVFLKSSEISYILNNSEVRLLITSTKFLTGLKEIEKKSDALKSIIITDKKTEGCLFLEDILDKKCANNPKQDISEKDLALISYTSSTTGFPKGAMLTHKNLTTDTSSCLKAIKVKRNDAILMLLPAFHSFTLTVCVFLPVMTQARIVIVESIKRIDMVMKALLFCRVTIIVGIPQLYKVFKDIKLPFIFSLLSIFSPLRLAISGAAALDKNVAAAFSKKFKIKLLEGYGLTEASPVVSINPVNGLNKVGSVGLALPGVAVKVVDEEENELPPNQVGELIVKGLNVMRGYYNMPEETAD